jgi:hypothetical protein
MSSLSTAILIGQASERVALAGQDEPVLSGAAPPVLRWSSTAGGPVMWVRGYAGGCCGTRRFW